MGSLLTKNAVIELIKDSSRAIRRKIVKKDGKKEEADNIVVLRPQGSGEYSAVWQRKTPPT